MKTTYKILIPTVVISIGLGAWFYATPYLTVRSMKQAAIDNDPVTLNSYIDYPAVKESLTAAFTGAVVSNLLEDEDASPLGVFGTAMASAMIGPMIDGLVTPETMSKMMKGKFPNAADGDSNHADQNEDFKIEMGYKRFDQFAIRITDKQSPSEVINLVLHRDGWFSWKLAELHIPPEAYGMGAKAKKPAPRQIGYTRFVGKHPTEFFKDADNANQFRGMLNVEYEDFLAGLAVASEIELHGDYVLGTGCMPHVCMEFKSAFAVNNVTGEGFACTLKNDVQFRCYGANSVANLPAPLYKWYKDNGGEN